MYIYLTFDMRAFLVAEKDTILRFHCESRDLFTYFKVSLRPIVRANTYIIKLLDVPVWRTNYSVGSTT